MTLHVCLPSESDTGGDGLSELSASEDVEPHDWRYDAPPEWDQEVPVAAYKGLHDSSILSSN